MDLKMEVYTPGLELLGLLEVQNSAVWENKAFGAGSFSVSSILTKETRPLLAAENIIWIARDDAGVIEYINLEAEDSTNITVKGCDLTGLLARRILWGRYDLSGTPPQIMHYLVNECAVNPTRGDTVARKIPGLVLLDPPTGGTSIRIQRTGGELLETLEELGATYGVAFGIRFNPAVPQMEFWTRWGVNRSIRQSVNDPVFYSTELDDVLTSQYTYNSGDYRNVALIAGEGEGSDRVMVTVEGEDETYIPDVPTPEPTPDKYTVNLSVDPTGGGVATGGGTVDGGTSITVTAAPAQKYGFVGWRENGAIVSTEPAYTFTVNRNRNLTAVFVSTVVMYTVTVLADPAGGGTVSGGGSVEEGKSVTLTQTTADGYNFTGWYSGGTLLSTANPYTFTPTANITVTAKFAVIPTYTITVLVDPAGGGTASGGGVVQQGQLITLTQTTADGYRFTGWYSSTGVLLSENSAYTFTPTESAVITAKFAVIPVYTVTATIDPMGAGTVTGAGQYQEGAEATITATPAEGYTFSGWAENGTTVSTSESYTFTVTGNRAFVAGFAVKAPSRLPEGYTEIEYIESTGTQYINTGVKPTITTKVVMDVEITDTASGCIFGSNRYSNNLYYRYEMSSGANYFYAGVCDKSPSSQSIAVEKNVLRRVSIKFDPQSKAVYIDSVFHAITVPTSLSSAYMVNLYLLSRNYNDAARQPVKAKLYSTQIYKGESLEKDLAPCTNPSGEAGLYDLVSGSFYRNAGSGTFVAGPAV